MYSPALALRELAVNTTLINEYSSTILAHLSHLESSNQISAPLIDMQPEIQWYMRPYLLDFLSETHHSLRLQPQTYFLAWSIIDRYCSKRVVFKKHYQLMGCTALLIAAKYEDKKSRVPTLQDLVHLTRQTYDETMFKQMERHVLTTLDWHVGAPTYEECLQLAITEVQRHSPALPSREPVSTSKSHSQSALFQTPRHGADPRTASGGTPLAGSLTLLTETARFFLEIALYDKAFLAFPPSLVGIAAVAVSCEILGLSGAAAMIRHYENTIDESHWDENSPPLTGPFLSGCNPQAQQSLKTITLLLITSLTSVSEFVQKKYQPLGVCQAINHYIHSRALALKPVLEATHDLLAVADLTALAQAELAFIADSLLGLQALGAALPSAPETPPLANSSRYSDNSAVVTPNSSNSPFFPEFLPYSTFNVSAECVVKESMAKECVPAPSSEYYGSLPLAHRSYQW